MDVCSHEMEETYLQILLLELTILTIILGLALKRVLKKTLYSFAGIALTAGILFCITAMLSVGEAWTHFAAGQGNHSAVTLVQLLIQASGFLTGIAFYAMLLMSALLAVSNLALIRHEGFRMKNVYGTLLGLFFVAATLVLRFLTVLLQQSLEMLASGNLTLDMIAQTTLFQTVFFGFLLPWINCLLCYAECMTGAILILGWAAARQVPAYDKDFIIILGCSITKDGGLRPLLKQRTNRAIRYAWEQEIASGKPVRFVPSGGQGPDEIISEASAMALYLEAHSAEPDEILPEKRSRNTRENFRFSREIILREKPDAKTAFATTNYHIFRSGMIARQEGFRDIEAISSRTKWYFWPNGFAREIVAIFVMTLRWHLIAAALLAVLCLINMTII